MPPDKIMVTSSPSPRPFVNRIATAVFVMIVTCSGVTNAQTDTLEDRVGRLERAISSEILVELLRQVERLQQEVQELRGELEVQSHELSQLKLRQRELYLDIDRRMSKLETARPAASTDSGTASAAGDGGSETAPETGGTVTAVVDAGAEREAYQSAFDLLKTGRYEDAAKEFTGFLAAYPAGEHADNAQYWLGEAYYVTRAFEPALQEFQKLVQIHPESAKVSHALLKIGYIQDELGDKQAAVKSLNELIERFPTTTAARLAQERLQQIQ